MTGVTLDTAAAAARAQTDKGKLSAAAKQFEAIFVRQMLAEARKASFGDPLFGSSAVDTFREMQDNRFAEIASERGVFGLAKSIEAQLGARIGSSARASTGSARAGDAIMPPTFAQPELVEGHSQTPPRNR